MKISCGSRAIEAHAPSEAHLPVRVTSCNSVGACRRRRDQPVSGLERRFKPRRLPGLCQSVAGA